MGLKDRLRRAEREAEEEMLAIPQRDGSVVRFPKSAGIEAFSNMMDRLGAGEDAPPEHPLLEAARNSSDSKWAGSFYAVNESGPWTEPVEDLSEP